VLFRSALALRQDRLACRCRRDDCTAAPAADHVAPADRVAPAGNAGADGEGRAVRGEGRAAGAVPQFGSAGNGVPGKPRTHVYVHVDLAALAHLADAPAYLERHGAIAGEYARMLAENASWQLVFTEARSLAARWCVAHPEDDADPGPRGEVCPPGRGAGESGRDAESAAEEGAD